MTELEENSPAAGHEAYVRAVVAEMAARGVEVDELTFVAAPVRGAMMRIVVDADSSASSRPRSEVWRTAQWLRLRWDELSGWGWQVRYAGDSAPRAAIFFGVTALPRPSAVADWIPLWLAHPEIAPSRDDGPFTTPDLDVVLRSYAVMTE